MSSHIHSDSEERGGSEFAARVPSLGQNDPASATAAREEVMTMDEVFGSITGAVEGEAYTHLLGTWPGEQTYTVTRIIRARWWKRPWLWLRRKPTKIVDTFTDCRFAPPRLAEDGTISVDFSGEHRAD